MLNTRTWIYIAASALLTYGVGARLGCASELDVSASWRGEAVGRMAGIRLEQLLTSLRSFFGGSTGAIVPKVGPLLFDQFNGVGEPDEYRLPDGRRIVDAADGRAGIDAVAVIAHNGSPSVLAAAFLTNLCPKSGVEESFVTSKGAKYTQHFRCELDYSLIVLYRHGSAPDADLNLDLTRWAEASVEARPQWAVPSDRKLTLKRFVRVLNEHPLDLNTADDVFPINAPFRNLDTTEH
jgi:hypothetical protein